MRDLAEFVVALFPQFVYPGEIESHPTPICIFIALGKISPGVCHFFGVAFRGTVGMQKLIRLSSDSNLKAEYKLGKDNSKRPISYFKYLRNFMNEGFSLVHFAPGLDRDRNPIFIRNVQCMGSTISSISLLWKM